MGALIGSVTAGCLLVLVAIDIVLRLLMRRCVTAASTAAPAAAAPPPDPAHHRELAALRKILRTVISESSRDAVLREIGTAVASVFEREWVSVLVPESGGLRVVLERGGALAPVGAWIQAAGTLLEQAIARGEAAARTGDGAMSALPADLLRNHPARTVVALPAVGRESVTCVLVLADRRELPPPTAEEMRTALGYADLAGLAIEQARLGGELGAKVRELATLNEIAGYEMAAITSCSPGIDDCLGRTLDLVHKLLRVDACSFMLIDEGSRELYVHAGRGGGPGPAGTLRLKIGEGIAGRAAECGEPVWSTDLESDRRFVPQPGGMPAGTCLLSVPMKSQNRVVGVINVRVAGRRFSEEEAKSLRLVAARTALAVENARCTELLETERKMFQVIVETLADGIVVLDRNGLVLHANAAVGEFAGADPVSLLFRPWHELCHVRTADGTRIEDRRNPFGRLGASDGESRSLEIEIVRPDGTVSRLDARCTMVRDAAGAVVLGIASLRAVGRAQSDEARRAIQCIIEEVRSPLLSASNTLEMLLGGQLGPLSPDQKKGITTSISNLKKILLSNGSLSRVSAGRVRGEAASA